MLRHLGLEAAPEGEESRATFSTLPRSGSRLRGADPALSPRSSQTPPVMLLGGGCTLGPSTDCPET